MAGAVRDRMIASGGSTQRSRRRGGARGAWLVTVCLALLGPGAATGCLPGPPCAIDETRCEGGVLERCTAHPGGIYGPIEDPHHVSGSGPDWENVADCGLNQCVVPGTGVAFCALDTTPSPSCASADRACDGATLVACRDGYAVERRACSACDAATTTCRQGVGDGCASASCGSPLACNADPYATCELPCACPEGAPCDACGAGWAQAPDGGVTLKWTCKSGLCAFHY